MKRRHVLAGLMLAFGCAPSGRRLVEETPPPDDLEDEPAPEVKVPGEPLPHFAELQGSAAAEVASRPLLVFVIPNDQLARWQRGRVFGELLNHGDDASLAPLALFEVVCAPLSTLKESYPGVDRGREPWLVVVDRTRLKFRARAFADRELDELAALDSPEEANIDARMARLAALFKSAAEPAMVERLADLEESALSPALKDELVVTTRDFGRARIVLAGAAAATIYRWAFGAAPKDDDDDWARSEREGVAGVSLAGVVRDRLVASQPPKGSRWGRSGGCGTRYEGARSHAMIGCGMGHVPERSRRFLAFYTDSAEDPAG